MNSYKLDLEKYAALARQAVAEGCVLLENEGQALPLRDGERVAVFGRMAFHYYKSGLGSGGLVNTRYVVGILDALKECEGVHLDEKLMGIYEDWIMENPYDEGQGWGRVPWCQKEMDVTEEMLDCARRDDVSLVVIGRTAGEDQDNNAGPGSYCLTETEEDMIRRVCQVSKRTVVVLNVGNIIDMSWVEKYHPQAVLYAWQGGQEGGNGVADVLTGKVCACGKLTDTIAQSIEDYPSTENFGDPFKNYYKEDIYVGYRYFETFAPDKVVYEFGYGLSYTTFNIETLSAKADNGKISLEIKVTNTGDRYSGKEVVQVYCKAPQGKLGKPVKVLCGYEKTKCLNPGESQIIKIDVDEYSMASYDDSGVTGHKSCYVLEAGDYEILVGNSVKKCESVFTYQLDDIVVVEQLSEVMCPDDDNLTILKPGAKKEDGSYEKVYIPSQKPTVDLGKRIEENLPKTMEITGDVGITLQDVHAGKSSVEEFVAQLSVEELAQIVRGEGMSNPRVTKGTASAFGGLSDSLFNYGIPAACTADGPSGLRMEAKATQLPIGTALSASWNPKLVRELYTMEGMELCRNEVDTLLGPGVNIHRHPLNGRNFEYYSEDPYLSGTMSVASTGGIKDGGAWGTIKHFALNGQEAHRFKIDAVCSERAIREIYLKSFEMAVKEKTVMTLMTSYNPINGHWAASNYDLCTTVLRGEWGYEGIVMTDWWAKMNDVVEKGEESGQKTRDMVRSQNDVYMVVNNNGAEINSNNDDTEKSVEEGRLTVGELQRAAINICNFILSAQVIERELIDTDVANHYPSVPVSEAKYEQFNLAEDNKVMFNGGKEATMIVEEDAEYTIIVNIAFEKSNLAQSTVNVNANGENMVVIQTNGTDGNWITQKLCKVKLDKGAYNIKLEDVLAGIKVKYMQFKKLKRK